MAVDENTLSLRDNNGNSLIYEFEPASGILYQTQDNQITVALQDCQSVRFSVFQRTPIGGSFEHFPVATPETSKVVQVSWESEKNLMGQRNSSQSTYSATVVIRNGQ